MNQEGYVQCASSDILLIPPERINYLAIGYTAPYLTSILSRTALEQYESISQYLSRKWDGDPALHAQVWEMNGCVEKLTTSILQIERLSNHQNQLLTQAIDATKELNPRDAVFLASEVSSDFESILLQSRAALDRLTNFVFLEIVATIRSILSTAEKNTTKF
jgi:hypothetical protein